MICSYLSSDTLLRGWNIIYFLVLIFISFANHFILCLNTKRRKENKLREKRELWLYFLHPLPKTLQRMEKTMSRFKPQNWLIKAVDDHTHQLGQKQLSIHTVFITATSGSLRWKTGTAMLLSEVCRVRKSSRNPHKMHWVKVQETS